MASLASLERLGIWAALGQLHVDVVVDLLDVGHVPLDVLYVNVEPLYDVCLLVGDLLQLQNALVGFRNVHWLCCVVVRPFYG
jgi:hypothetical protein